MSIFAGKRVKLLSDGRVRVRGDVTLAELYEAAPSRELYVEPVSDSQPLAAFLAAGGLGFGSLRNGTFGGQVLRLRGTYSDESGEVDFRYGLGRTPLYNVGYPLQRIVEGPGARLVAGRFGPATEMILRTRERGPVAVGFSAAETPDLPDPDGDDNVLFVNAAAAKAMGLAGAGIVKARAGADAASADGWSRRFAVAGSAPGDHRWLTVLTQPSGAKALFEAHRAEAATGAFLALAVHLGALVMASAPAQAVARLAEKAKALPLTWRLED